MYLSNDPLPKKNLTPYFEYLLGTFHGRLGTLGVRFLLDEESPEKLMQWFEEAEKMVDHTVVKSEHALLYRSKGRLLLHMKREYEAIESFERSVAIYQNKENGAISDLVKLYAKHGYKEKFNALRKQFDIQITKGSPRKSKQG